MGIGAIIFAGRFNSCVMLGLPRFIRNVINYIKDGRELRINFKSSSAPFLGMNVPPEKVRNAMCLKGVGPVRFFSHGPIATTSLSLANTLVVRAMRHLAKHGLTPLRQNGLIITIDGSEAKVQIL